MGKIRVSKNVFEAFGKELILAASNHTRTMGSVTDSDVLQVLKHPGSEIEIVDHATGKIIGTITAGVGGAGLAALIAGGTAAAVGGTTTVAGTAALTGASTFYLTAPALAASAAVPGPGWIIAGAILAVTAITATGIAIASVADKKRSEKHFNEKQALHQDTIDKLVNEMIQMKKEKREETERFSYLDKLCAALGIHLPSPIV